MEALEKLDFDEDFLNDVIEDNFDSPKSLSTLIPEFTSSDNDDFLSYVENLFFENSVFEEREYNSFESKEIVEKRPKTREEIMREHRKGYGNAHKSREKDIMNARMRVYSSRTEKPYK